MAEKEEKEENEQMVNEEDEQGNILVYPAWSKKNAPKDKQNKWEVPRIQTGLRPILIHAGCFSVDSAAANEAPSTPGGRGRVQASRKRFVTYYD